MHWLDINTSAVYIPQRKMCLLARAHFALFCFFLSGRIQQLLLKFPGRRIQRTVPVINQTY